MFLNTCFISIDSQVHPKQELDDFLFLALSVHLQYEGPTFFMHLCLIFHHGFYLGVFGYGKNNHLYFQCHVLINQNLQPPYYLRLFQIFLNSGCL
jgi:hypothetical protein